MFFKELDKIKRSTIMSVIVLMFIGVVLLVTPQMYFPFINGALGFAFLVASVVAVMDFIGSKKALIHFIELFFGLFSGLFGMLLFVFETLFYTLLSLLVGIAPILLGLYGIYHSVVFARRSGRRGWGILVILSVLLILFGGFIFYNPWADSPESMMKVIGGTMMYSAFVTGIELIWIWPPRKDREEEDE